MKTLTFADVQAVAEDLIDKNGSTTTLDVKNALRALDFWSTQDFVSTSLESMGYNFTNNGIYRVYDKSAPVAQSVKVTCTPKVTKSISRKFAKGSKATLVMNPTGSHTAFTYTKRDGKVIEATTVATPDSKFHGYSANSVVNLYFESGATKDEMRYIYKKIAEIPYKDTRVLSVK